MATDQQLRDFRTVTLALGADPDLARARADQLRHADEDLSPADAFLVVLRELADGAV